VETSVAPLWSLIAMAVAFFVLACCSAVLAANTVTDTIKTKTRIKLPVKSKIDLRIVILFFYLKINRPFILLSIIPL
jgi:hypothetical protein